MLRIVEIGTALDLTNARTKEKENNDYLYILKYNNTFLLIDNGTEHYMSGIMEYTQEQYDALTTVHNNVLYMVSNIIDNSTSYSIYYGNTKIDAHEHLNKEILDKFSESVDGKLLYNGALIEGSGGSADLTEIQEQIDDITTELLDYTSYASIKVGDVYTVVDFKRSDATLYLKSTLSNADGNGYYQTCTLHYYDSLGTTIIKTVIWTFIYDIDGKIVTKVVA